MKSLLDLQQDVRTLENSISDVIRSLRDLNDDIDMLRNAETNNDIDYKKIELLAKHIPFNNHPLGMKPDRTISKLYLQLLLNLTRLDLNKENTTNRLVFIQWIKAESKIDLTLEDLYNDTFDFKSESLGEFVDFASVYSGNLIVDALIIAGLSGRANAAIYEYIAGLSEAFGIEKQKLNILAMVAKVALTQSVQSIKDSPRADIEEFLIIADKYKHYIKSDEISRGKLLLRQIVFAVSVGETHYFKWKVNQSPRTVKAGETIATYEERISGLPFQNAISKEKTKKSPETGTLFQFRDNHVYYAVLAHESDDKDSIKEWINNKM